jgi:thiamine biosynthesis protein ThiI
MTSTPSPTDPGQPAMNVEIENQAAMSGQTGMQAARHGRILLHSPDITLKGKNQGDFQQQLEANIRQRLRALGLSWQVGSARGRAWVDTTGRGGADTDAAVRALGDIAGVTSLAAAVWLQPGKVVDKNGNLNWPLLEDALADMARTCFQPGVTFAVRVNRTDKSLPASSQEMEQRLGGVIRSRTGWDKVDLTRPGRTFYIDAYTDGLYVYADKHSGIGGLPVGTGGHMLALLSGGIDSPVAAFMLAKRGCIIDLFHLTAAHLDPARAGESVVLKLAAEISRFSLRSRLYAAPYTYFDLALKGGHTGYELVLFRRFLMRMAEKLAGRLGAAAVITGDSLGQVASQTVENITTASEPVTLPVLRPLIGMNKQEIIEHARRIGTYEISIQPYKDCCALIGRHPRTRTQPEAASRLETEMFPDYEQLMEKTFADMVRYDLECGRLVGTAEDPWGQAQVVRGEE